VGGDSERLHDSAGHNAQRGSWINLNVTHFRQSNVPYIIQGPIMFFFNLYVFLGEYDAGKPLRGVVAMVVIFLSAYSRNLVMKTSASANASLKVSFVDLVIGHIYCIYIVTLPCLLSNKSY